MKKWTVTGVVTGSKYLGTYEAETAEEAIEMALESEAASCSVCHQCSSQVEDPQIERAVASEDLD